MQCAYVHKIAALPVHAPLHDCMQLWNDQQREEPQVYYVADQHIARVEAQRYIVYILYCKHMYIIG